MKIFNNNPLFSWSKINRFEEETEKFFEKLNSREISQSDMKEFVNKTKLFKKGCQVKGIKQKLLSLFFDKTLKEFCYKRDYDYQKAYFALKLAKLDCNPEFIKPSEELGTPTSDLLDILVDSHISERMQLYGHKFDPSSEPKFRSTVTFDARATFEGVGLSTLEEQFEYVKKGKGSGLKLRLEGRFEDDRVKDFEVDALSDSEIKDILTWLNQGGGPYKIESVDFVQPTQEFTVNELVAQGVLIRDPETQKISIEPHHQYTDEGFTYHPPVLWRSLRPIHSGSKVDKFTVEILVSAKGKPSVLSNQGHVHVLLRTPSGKEHSIGLYPGGGIGNSISDATVDVLNNQNFNWQLGVLKSGDDFIYTPKSAFWTGKKVYELNSADHFHSVIDLFNRMQGYHADATGEYTGMVMYHLTEHSCASLGEYVENHVVQKLNAKQIHVDYPFASKVQEISYRLKKYVMVKALSLGLIKKRLQIIKGVEIDGIRHEVKEQLAPILPADILLRRPPPAA